MFDVFNVANSIIYSMKFLKTSFVTDENIVNY